MSTLRWLLVPIAAALLGLSAACGGDDDGGSAGDGGSVSTELDLSSVATDLLELRSFRFDMSLKMDFDLGAMASEEEDEFSAGLAAAFLLLLSNIQMEGTYVAPDSFDMKMQVAGEEVHIIQIGNRAWINEGSGWEETDADTGALSFLGDPSEMGLDFLPQEVLRNAKTKSEKVNGIETTRYSFDKKALEALAAELGEDTAGLEEIDTARLDVWMTKDNIPVKIAMDVKGTAEDGSKMAITMEFNVTDLNSDRIKIEAPI
jgi:hypothetical protein